MRLAIFSDLHTEFAPFDPPGPALEADVVVLAGDIGLGVRALEAARAMFPSQRIVQVAGNHEFFHADHDTALAAMRVAAQDLGIDFLERDAVLINGVEFLGTTLWTDFGFYARPGQPRSMSMRQAIRAMRPAMADYRRIHCGSRRLRPTDTIRWHRSSVAWLRSRLSASAPQPESHTMPKSPSPGMRLPVSTSPAARSPGGGPLRRVVITHHLPSARSVSPAYATAATNPAFASHLDLLIEPTDLWIHGHTHASSDYRIGRARVICNPRGYRRSSGVWENPAFDPCRVLQLPDDRQTP